MNRIWSSSSVTKVDVLLQIAENTLCVTELAEADLRWAKPEWTTHQTLTWMREQGFDAAPVEDPEPCRVVTVQSLQPNGHPITLQTQPLDATLLVSSDLSLADGIARLKRQQFYFVIRGDKLYGIVTRADLQRPAVSMIIFSLILASEAATREIIDRVLPSTWLDKIRPPARAKVEEIYHARLRSNTEVSRLDCVMLHDLLALLFSCTGVINHLGFTNNQFKNWKKQLTSLRDTLAHGGGLLQAEPDPLDAVQLFENVRRFAIKTTELIANQGDVESGQGKVADASTRGVNRLALDKRALNANCDEVSQRTSRRDDN